MAGRIGSENILRCPFCEQTMPEIKEIMTKFGNIVSGGRCECGAAFVYDGSGHNVGDAYVDALSLACEGDMDRAWSMIPDEDYEVRELSYNTRRNKLGREISGRGKRSPVYLFVLIKKKDLE